MANSLLILSVTQLNTYIRSIFEQDEHLAHVFVAGEISNFTSHYRSGHLYFSLKDDQCAVKAVMFARYAERLRFLPEDGMRVIARGHVGVYEATGQYQLYVEDLQPDGVGALSLAFEQLKARLEKEGLFSRKKPIPKFPKRVGVVTSPSGAAVHDIVTVLGRRYPAAEVVFCPVAVQGADAAPQIVRAVERMNRLACADVLIVGRGGGSLEDLWPFNEELVARAVAGSRIPVISAVGHETDFTICDFAADLRAPTPSAAAELAVPDRAELLEALRDRRRRMRQAAEKALGDARGRVDALAGSRTLKNPLERPELLRVKIDRLASALSGGMDRKAAACRSRLSAAGGRLNDVSPLAVLSRGYAVACGGDGRPLRGVEGLRPGEPLLVKLDGGDVGCTVENISKRDLKRSEAGIL